MTITEKAEAHAAANYDSRGTNQVQNFDDAKSPHRHEEHDHEHGFEIADLIRVLFVALAAAAVWFRIWEPFHHVSVIGLAATLIGGYPSSRRRSRTSSSGA